MLRPACDSEIEELVTSQRGGNLLAPLGSGSPEALLGGCRMASGGGSGGSSLSVGSPAVSSDKPRRQHYVSAMLLKQWGDIDEGRDTKIAYYDMYRRTTEFTTAAAECVAQDMTFTDEAEQEWGDVETVAAPLLDGIRQQMQETGGEISRPIEQRLMAPKNKAILCRLAALHHGRNFSVLLSTWIFAQKLGLTPERTQQYLQEKIARRVREAEERYLGRGAVLWSPGIRDGGRLHPSVRQADIRSSRMARRTCGVHNPAVALPDHGCSSGTAPRRRP